MARPRKRDEHGTDAAYRYCRAGVDGGRCDACKDAHADAEARRAAARRGLPGPPTEPEPEPPEAEQSASVTVIAVAPETSYEPGPTEMSVMLEVRTLSAARRRLSSVQSALVLARGLDNPKMGTSHAGLQRQLEATMKSLREASTVDRGGRLAPVAQMTQRRPKRVG